MENNQILVRLAELKELMELAEELRGDKAEAPMDAYRELRDSGLEALSYALDSKFSLSTRLSALEIYRSAVNDMLEFTYADKRELLTTGCSDQIRFLESELGETAADKQGDLDTVRKYTRKWLDQLLALPTGDEDPDGREAAILYVRSHIILDIHPSEVKALADRKGISYLVMGKRKVIIKNE